MDNLNYWPSTNIHELNLDWIIAKVKELDTRFTDDIESFVQEYINEHFAEWTVNANYNPDDETIIYTNGTGATLTAGDVIRFAIDNAYVNVKDAAARTAINNMPTTILNALHPVGSEYVTSEDVAPAIGGTWTLIDKELSDVLNYVLSNSEYTALSSTTVDNIILRRTSHEIALRYKFSNVSISDTSTQIVRIDPAVCGLTSFNATTPFTFFSDTGNVIGSVQISPDGTLTCTDAWVLSTSGLTNAYTGALSVIQILLPVDHENMLDAACSRFIWKRIS